MSKKLTIIKTDNMKETVPDVTGTFVKWMYLNHPEIEVETPDNAKKALLRSQSLIMPIVSLALDMSLLNYLALVLEFAKFKFQGSLEGDKNVISLRVRYKDEINGVEKEFSFDGTESALENTVEKFSINDFMRG
ncbi:hypothetical protein IG509_16905 [Vibrio cholerae]|nr:hypothetical protein [Vibrio cholerae]GIC28244.1 hypothetical protein VCSRO99_3591 [Vibrio cholerae]